MTRQEKCKIIAEWLGLHPDKCTTRLAGHSVSHDHLCMLNVSHMKTAGVMDWELPHRCECGYVWDATPLDLEKQQAPDFYTSEEASGAAFDRLPMAKLERHNDGSFSCQYIINGKNEWEWSPLVFWPDRKTAIAETAYELASKSI